MENQHSIYQYIVDKHIEEDNFHTTKVSTDSHINFTEVSKILTLCSLVVYGHSNLKYLTTFKG